MPHFMMKVKFSSAFTKDLVADPHDRRHAASALAEAAGGKLLHYYFSFGDADGIAIFDFPDATAPAAVSMALGASGGFASVETVPLLTMDEAVAATKKAGAVQAVYKLPGKK